MPPSSEHSVVNTNESDREPLDVFGMQDAFKDKWNRVNALIGDDVNFYFREIGDQSDFLVRIIHSNPVGAPSGDYLDLRLERFLPSTAYDVRTKRQVEVRRRIIGRSAEGEPIFPALTIAACEFVDRYEPAGDWMSKSEWASIKKELAPLIDHEKAVKQGERCANTARCEKIVRASSARDNPHEALAAGIAAGVAEAMKALGIGAKGSK